MILGLDSSRTIHHVAGICFQREKIKAHLHILKLSAGEKISPHSWFVSQMTKLAKMFGISTLQVRCEWKLSAICPTLSNYSAFLIQKNSKKK